MATNQALDTWRDIAEYLNQTIEEKGSIKKNDFRLWRKYLHRWDNQVWLEIIEAASELYRQHPEYFQPFHKAAVKQAITAIMNGDPAERIMDQEENKAVAWKMIMTLREVWNATKDTKAGQQQRLNQLFETFMD